MRMRGLLIALLLLLLSCGSPTAPRPVDTGWPTDPITIPSTVSYVPSMSLVQNSTNEWLIYMRFTTTRTTPDSVLFRGCSFATRLHRRSDLSDAPAWDTSPPAGFVCDSGPLQTFLVMPGTVDSMEFGGVASAPWRPLPSGHFYVALAIRPGGQLTLVKVGTVDVP